MLKSAYLEKSLPIVQRQVLIAGYRLAGMLNAAERLGKVKAIETGLLERTAAAAADDLRLRK